MTSTPDIPSSSSPGIPPSLPSLQQARINIQTQLAQLYPAREAANIADWVLENISGKKKIDRIVYKNNLLSPEEFNLYTAYTNALLSGIPVQYVLHESWFCGLKFYVDENVLIPRPETEELVAWISEDYAGTNDSTGPTTSTGSTTSKHSKDINEMSPASPLKVLDVGTGSGCIAISLARQLPGAHVHACDLSEKALGVASLNATRLNSVLSFHHIDFLDANQWLSLPQVHVLVSNPPYIPSREKTAMTSQVVDHEPSMALFVPDNDPLVSYRALARFGKDHLLPGGSLYAEIHEDLGTPSLTLFESAGYKNVMIRKDMQGKDRMVKATRPL